MVDRVVSERCSAQKKILKQAEQKLERNWGKTTKKFVNYYN